jgi:hypothetical protein
VRIVLPGQKKAQLAVIPFFLKGNLVLNHVVLVLFRPLLGAREHLPSRENTLSNRANQIILNDLFVFWRIVDDPILIDGVSDFVFFKRETRRRLRSASANLNHFAFLLAIACL